MPTFKFDDDIEPVIVKLGDDEYRAMPAIPALMLDDFMDLFGQIPPLVERLTRKAPAIEAAESGSPIIETTVVGDDAPPSTAPVPVGGESAAAADSRDKLDAYRDFIRVSLEGLELVILPGDDYDRLKERLGSRERPVKPVLLANMFATLAAFYMSGDKREDKESVGEGPTGGDNESSPSSDTTGGSSEANSSERSDSPNSNDGTTTT